jgi:hypothetical protein
MREATDHKRITPEGKLSGFKTAMLIEPVVQQFERDGIPDTRCKSCAGTYGTVPNGCLQTQADFIKAVSEGVPFFCHAKTDQVCHAWMAAHTALKGRTQPCPWDFSPADELPTAEPIASHGVTL